jgi:hypothetical protein
VAEGGLFNDDASQKRDAHNFARALGTRE